VNSSRRKNACADTATLERRVHGATRDVRARARAAARESRNRLRRNYARDDNARVSSGASTPNDDEIVALSWRRTIGVSRCAFSGKRAFARVSRTLVRSIRRVTLLANGQPADSPLDRASRSTPCVPDADARCASLARWGTASTRAASRAAWRNAACGADRRALGSWLGEGTSTSVRMCVPDFRGPQV